MDDLGRSLGRVEQSMECEEKPPSGRDEQGSSEEIMPEEPDAEADASHSRNVLRRGVDGSWTRPQPDPTDRVHHTRTVRSFPAYRHRGGGAGLGRGISSGGARICPMTNAMIDEEDCEGCDEYRDWTGMGAKTCSYDLDEGDL
jgi:hypothetical protein